MLPIKDAVTVSGRQPSRKYYQSLTRFGSLPKNSGNENIGGFFKLTMGYCHTYTQVLMDFFTWGLKCDRQTTKLNSLLALQYYTLRLKYYSYIILLQTK